MLYVPYTVANVPSFLTDLPQLTLPDFAFRVVFCRLNEAFQLASGAALTSATFAHALDPHWPLCPFEHAPRGACHNAACSFQMTVDYLLPPAPALDDVMKLANRCVSYNLNKTILWAV